MDDFSQSCFEFFWQAHVALEKLVKESFELFGYHSNSLAWWFSQWLHIAIEKNFKWLHLVILVKLDAPLVNDGLFYSLVCK